MNNYLVRSTEQVADENGVLVYRSIIKEADPRDNFKDLKATDYQLSNLMAVGAADMLRPGQLNGVNNLEYMDDIISTLDNVAAVDGTSSVDTVIESQNPNNPEDNG